MVKIETKIKCSSFNQKTLVYRKMNDYLLLLFFFVGKTDAKVSERIMYILIMLEEKYGMYSNKYI